MLRQRESSKSLAEPELGELESLSQVVPEVRAPGWPLKPLAKVAELADALDSGSSARKGVEVRVLFFAPVLNHGEHRLPLSKHTAPGQQALG